MGKALDDRALLAILTELQRRFTPNELSCDLTLGCSVSEEIGVVGAMATAVRSGCMQCDLASQGRLSPNDAETILRIDTFLPLIRETGR